MRRSLSIFFPFVWSIPRKRLPSGAQSLGNTLKLKNVNHKLQKLWINGPWLVSTVCSDCTHKVSAFVVPSPQKNWPFTTTQMYKEADGCLLNTETKNLMSKVSEKNKNRTEQQSDGHRSVSLGLLDYCSCFTSSWRRALEEGNRKFQNPCLVRYTGGHSGHLSVTMYWMLVP